MPLPRRICFVTGTRAEFGLMRSTLSAIEAHPRLQLQLIVTGMHLDRRHGRTVDVVRAEGWLDRGEHALVPWKSNAGSAGLAASTGEAMAAIAREIHRLQSDIVLVTGDRVEAFAASAAAHIGGKILAHVHGGDRALGQVDDALRHAITKLAHIHFPATTTSADRIRKLGEDGWRIHRVGSPGIDNIAIDAAPWNDDWSFLSRRYALVVLHPTDTDEDVEFDRAHLVLNAVRRVGFESVVIVYPNNDPGSAGIMRCWKQRTDPTREHCFTDVARSQFLTMMRDAAVLIGNSSSGIIEAASFGTPVINIGPRQEGRERSGNVTDVPFVTVKIQRELKRIWNEGRPSRCPQNNVYGGNGAGSRIANALAKVKLDERLRRKLIAY
jgi:GDP/UDP-N,N'-diacetylbacillosamine 2-epimerase (hydrolysing)